MASQQAGEPFIAHLSTSALFKKLYIPKSVALQLIESLYIPAIEALLEKNGDHLNRVQQQYSGRGSSKNKQGDALTDADIDVQQDIYEELKEKHPDFVFVGEEKIRGGCLKKFPTPLDPGTVYCSIDPIDGTNNFMNNSPDFAINVGFQLGYKPFFGIAYYPKTKTLVMGGPHTPTTINHKPVNPPRRYNKTDIRVGYGVGKLKPEEERKRYTALVTTTYPEHTRPGCLSVSVLKFLSGEIDFNGSLKEKWTNYVTWCAILLGYFTKVEVEGDDDAASEKEREARARQWDWVINIDPTALNLNLAFCLYLATPDFEGHELGPDSKIAECLSKGYNDKDESPDEEDE